MRLIQGGGLNCLQFPALAKLPGFFHGVFLRHAADGQGRNATFDLGLGNGSPDLDVWQNRAKMLGFFGPDYCGVYARQVHGKEVALLQDCNIPTLSGSNHAVQLNGDALITDVAGAALVIQVADCQPIIIIDPLTGAVGNIHSGWRGSIQNIIGETVGRMVAEYKCRPENLVCGIGPSLGPCCAEFVNFKDEIPHAFWRYRRAGALFDFWQISIDQLIETGVRPENISLAEMCTKCNRHLFFSYRREQLTGRFAAVVGIRSGKGSEHDSAKSDD